MSALVIGFIEVQFWRNEEFLDSSNQMIQRLWNGDEYSPYFVLTYTENDFDGEFEGFDFPVVLNTNSTSHPEMWAGSQY